MPDIRPFKAIRPKKGFEEKIAALPYDVYSSKEAREVVKNNPLSFLKIDRAETAFDESVDMYSKPVYEKAKELYEDMKNKGYFVKEEKSCFYLYEETMNGRAQTGLVCVASVSDYVNNIIKKHENTRADKEEDRIRHVDTVNAQTGPIFLACKDDEQLLKLFNTIKENDPLFDFVSDAGIRHRGFIIDDSAMINEISQRFRMADSLYIADGHHRCASAVRVSLDRRAKALADKSNLKTEDNFNSDLKDCAEHEHFLSVIFPESELMIMDYNRVLKDLNGLTKEEFINKVMDKFLVKKIELSDNKPSKKGDIYMLFEDEEYVINLKPEFLVDDPVKSLDVSVLQDNLLAPVLEIIDPKTDKRIDFIGGIRGVKELRKRLLIDGKVAFAMFPTQMNELFKVADAGLLMPPKSTWFEPKLRSGLFIHELD